MAGETDSEAEGEKKPLSKKKQRKLNRLTVAELKHLVAKPEVVEWTDVSAADPRLLLHLKCYRNTIPIPEGCVPTVFLWYIRSPCGTHSAQWGFHPGGWGKPPLDEYNRPLYGDVFGVLPKANDTAVGKRYLLSCAFC